MVGLFNIGLGPGHTSKHLEDFAQLGAAYWLGAGVNIIAVPILISFCLILLLSMVAKV